MTDLIPLKLKCKFCKHDLSDKKEQIDGFPSVKLKVSGENGTGDIWLSPLYGSYNLKSSIKLEEGECVTLYCPHCNRQLPKTRSCENCSAPMVALALHLDQGDVEICLRKGCKNHYIEFRDLKKMKEFYETYEDFFRPGP